MMDKPKIIIVAAIGGILIFAILIFTGILPGLKKDLSKEEVELKMWGFENEESTVKELINEYSEQATNVKIEYSQKNQSTYEQELIGALAAGKGPDIFSLKNTWIVEHKDKIFPLPQEQLPFNIRGFRQVLVDTAVDSLIIKEKIAGIPLAIDTLALFYNKDHFNSAGIPSPPQTWEEVVALTKKLTKYTPGGDILRSGMALGSYANTDHAFEIISALLLQAGETIIDRESEQAIFSGRAESALSFYTLFSDPKSNSYSWNNRLPNSLQYFAEGKASMILGFLSDIKTIKEKNPHLNFDVAFLPQQLEAQKKITYASYTFKTVSKLSKNPIDAWKFILFMAEKDRNKKYLLTTNQAPARRDLILGPPPEMEVFYQQTLFAKEWPVPEEAAVLRIFKNMVESVETGRSSIDFAISQTAQQLNLLINKR